jgi:hypothetical protein
MSDDALVTILIVASRMGLLTPWPTCAETVPCRPAGFLRVWGLSAPGFE